MFWEIFLIIAAIIVVALAVTVYFICRRLFEMACARGQKMELGDGFQNQLAMHKDVWERGKEFCDTLEKEDVYMNSFDGHKLHGTLYRNEGSKKLLIEVHGFRSNPVHDFTATIPYFYPKGLNILLVDQRAHSSSEGDYITFGVHERLDLRDWVYYAMELLGTDIEIVLHGISMGATTVLMASELDLPENVKGIIADSGFTSPYDIFVEVLKTSFGAKPFPLLNIAEMMASAKAGFKFKDASTLDAMKVNKLPVLFVHGEDDDFVPMEMSAKNYEACTAEKSFVHVKGALHACSYLIDPDACECELDAFLAKTLKI